MNFIKTLLLGIFLTIGILPSFASENLVPKQPTQMAAVRVFNPNGPSQVGGGGHAFGPMSSYVQPLLINNYSMFVGDSRTANAGGLSYTSNSAVTSAVSSGANWVGMFGPLNGNKVLLEWGYNYAIGASTTLSLAARIGSTSIYANDPTNTGGVTFTALKATTTGATWTIASNASSPITVALTGFTGGSINTGTTYVIQSNGAIQGGCQILANGTNLTTTQVTLPTGCIGTSNLTLGYTMIFVPISQANPFWTFLQSWATTQYGSGTDISINKSGGGTRFDTSNIWSTESDPAQTVYLLDGTNDGFGAAQTAYNMSYVFNQLGPNGPGNPNKIIIVSDEAVKGLGTGGTNGNGGAELKSIQSTTACGPYAAGIPCVTVAGAATFFNEVAAGGTPLPLYYAPTGSNSGTGYVAPSNDGHPIGYCSSCTGSTPTISLHQFAYDGAGHYAFNSDDNGAQIAIWYRWGTVTNTLAPFNAWMNSTNCTPAGTTWVEPTTTTTFHNPGAKCPGLYPWVHVANTFTAVADPHTPSAPAPYVYGEGLHFTPYGALLVAQQMLATATAVGVVPSAPIFTVPTTNNWPIGGTLSTTATNQSVSSSTVGTCTVVGQKYFIQGATIGGTTPAAVYASSGGPAVLASLIGKPVYGSNYIPSGTTIVCVDWGNNAIELSQASTNTATSPNAGIYFVALGSGTSSLTTNGVFSYSVANYIGYSSVAGPNIQGCGTGNVYCPAPTISGLNIAHAIPVNWTLSIDGTNDCGTTPTGTRAQICNGIEGLSYGIVQNPLGDGYDGIIIQRQGVASAVAAANAWSISATTSTYTFPTVPLVTGSKIRAICRVLIGAGPNGHLAGTTGVALNLKLTTPSYLPPWLSTIPGQTGYIYTASQAGGGLSTSSEYSDAVLSSGASNVITVPNVPGGKMIQQDLLTPPVTVGGSSLSSAVISLSAATNAGAIISDTVIIERCAVIPAGQ
jgi:hypothetical protein